MKKRVIDELCEQLSSTFQLTPSRFDKTPQVPTERINTPEKELEPSGIQALLPLVESATPKRPPTPVKFSQDWDKSLYRQDNSILSTSSRQSTFIPKFSSFQANDQEILSEIKTELVTIKLNLKSLQTIRVMFIKKWKMLSLRCLEWSKSNFRRKKKKKI